MALAARAEWLKTRQQLLAQVKRQVQSRLGPAPRDLLAYVRRYNREFSRPWRGTTPAVLRREVAGADVVLGADFHAFSQSQRIHLRILRELPRRRQAVLALEAFSAADQRWLDRYQAGELKEAEFLDKIKWDQSWGFPFANYRPLLELARERQFKVVGINLRSGTKYQTALPLRDRFAAQIIARVLKDKPGALVYAIIGDLHLAQAHLPSAVERVAERRVRLVTLLQNSEHLYFRLARSGREHEVEVLRSSKGRFCVLGSPPWVKWQSYLIYLEQTYDRDLETGGIDFTDHVASYVALIARDLGVAVRLEDVAVFTADQEQIWARVRRAVSPAQVKLLTALVRHDRSFYVPEAEVLFLSRASVNHAATLAGYILHAKLCGRERFVSCFPDHFPAQIWIEAIGFFASKMINHKRKAEQIEDLRLQLKAAEGESRTREVLQLALGQRLAELSGRTPRFRPRQIASYLEAARIVGQMMGDRLYRAVVEGRIPLTQVKGWLALDPLAPEFRSCYFDLVRQIDSPRPGLGRGRR